MNQPRPCARVLLLGAEAEGLAPRLELSGYRGIVEGSPPPAIGSAPAPAAVILSPGYEARIPALRTQWTGVPLLLGVDTDDVAGRSHCLASGADDFWLTSLGPSDLLTRLRMHLQRQTVSPAPEPSPARPSPLRLGDLRVDQESGEVWRGARQISLTPREYQLLLLLLRHRDEVVSRERILNEIWDDQNPSSSNVIEVYVRYLRRKLEATGESRLIHTVRSRGYRLSAPAATSGPEGLNP